MSYHGNIDKVTQMTLACRRADTQYKEPKPLNDLTWGNIRALRKTAVHRLEIIPFP